MLPDKPIIVRETMDDRLYPTCDFCGAAPMRRPCRAYPARQFMIQILAPGYGELTKLFEGDGWAACMNCWPSIEQRDLVGLLDAFYREHPGERAPTMNLLLVKAWQMFFEHQTGPGIEHDPDSGPPIFPA